MCIPCPAALGHLMAEVADLHVRLADQTQQHLTSRRWGCRLCPTPTSLPAVPHPHLTAGCAPPPPHCRLCPTPISLQAVPHPHLTAGCTHGTQRRWTAMSVVLHQCSAAALQQRRSHS